MAKLTTDPIGSFTQAAVTTINTNFDRVEAALENTLSRDGTTPNQMAADLDMNHNDIINVDNIHADVFVLAGQTVNPTMVSVTDALLRANNLADLDDPAIARANLGVVTPAEIIDEFFPTKVAAEAYTPPTAPEFIYLAGYASVGDGGAALYKKVLSEPTHAGKFSITLADTVTVVWYEIAETVIRTSMLGGDLRAAIIVGDHVHIDADCSVSDGTAITKSKLKLTSDKGVTVTYTGTAGANATLYLTGVDQLVVEGPFEIDCASKAGWGIFAYANDGAKLVDVSFVTVNNAFQTAPATLGAGGVFVGAATGSGRQAKVKHCKVGPVSRDVAAGNCAGIAVTDFVFKEVEFNEVQDVSIGTGAADADGIKVFDQFDGSFYTPGVTSVRFNQVANCEGRFIKTQTRGKCAVKDNYFRFTRAITLIVSWVGVDAQTFDCEVENNTFDLVAPVTIAAGNHALFGLPRPSTAAAYTGQIIRATIINNVITVRGASSLFEKVTAFDLTALGSYAFDVRFKVAGNTIATDADWEADVATNYFAVWSMPASFVAGAKASIEVIGNTFASTLNIGRLGPTGGTAAHGGLGDFTGKLFLTITDNINTRKLSGHLLEYTNNDRFTSSILVARNACQLRGSSWAAPFNFSEILPGCDFSVPSTPTPAWANAPAAVSSSTVQHKGRHISVDIGTTEYISSLWPRGAVPTWTTYAR